MLTVVQPFEDLLERRILVADHDGLGMIQNRIDTVDHEPGYVRNMIEDEVSIGANQAGQVYIFIENTQVIAFADEVFNDLDHRTLSQIVRSCFETKAQHADPSVPLFYDES